MFLLEREIKAIQEAIKHLPGRHDQRNHGNRFGHANGNPRALIHHGGGAAGRNVIHDSQGNAIGVHLRNGKIGKKPKQPIKPKVETPIEPKKPLEEPVVNEFSLPSQKDFEEASLNEFNGGINTVFSTTIKGTKYFVKQANAGGDEMNEVVASQSAQSLGLEKYTLPMAMMQRSGENYVVAPWTKMKQFKEETNAAEKAVGNLSSEEYTKLHAYEYLMDDADRHGGNFLINPETGDFKIIDMGFALNKPKHNWFGRPFNASESKLDKYYAQQKNGNLAKIDNTQLDEAALREIVSKAPAIVQHMQDAKMPKPMINKLNKRIENLRQASMITKPTIRQIQAMGF